jgi:diacylglycerol kinase (ATP)
VSARTGPRRTVAVIVNAHSSRTERELPRLRELFGSHGVAIDGPYTVRDARALRNMIKRVAKRRPTVVAVGGGDGSMTCAANALAHHRSALGVLPLGTGNSFARTLGLTGEVEEAVAVIATGQIAAVDLGVVNGTYFANFATVGFPAEVAAASSNAVKRIVGVLAYIVGAVRPFIRHRPFRAKVRWDGGGMSLRTHQIVVASGRFFGRTPLTPDASITSGKLTFFTTTGVSHAELVRSYLALSLGKQNALPDAHSFMADRITVRARPKQRISIDGEPFGNTPARFTVAVNALRVTVPRAFPHLDSLA